MKFSKGLLNDVQVNTLVGDATDSTQDIAAAAQDLDHQTTGQPKPNDYSNEKQVDPDGSLSDVEKNRLFETVKESKRSSRKYGVLLGILAVVILAGAAALSYLTLPKFGDAVRAPRGLEAAVREHFLVAEKRPSTDIEFYYCETFYWARVSVEKRPDIKTNPIYQIGTYSARATETENNTWSISALPITSPETDVPCR